MSNIEMLKRLKVGLRQLNIAKKAQDNMADQLIGELPKDKMKEANALLNEARKGKMDISKFMSFASDLRDSDRQEFDKNVEESMDRINTKKEEIRIKKEEAKAKKASKSKTKK